MLDLDLAVLDANPDWRQVLLAYGEGLEGPSATGDETTDLVARGFRPRLREVAGVPAEQMTRVHGKLIAYGLLQVEIAGRTGGMMYQLTAIGRRACLQIAEASDDVCRETVPA
jgi:hypothetical protein